MTDGPGGREGEPDADASGEPGATHRPRGKALPKTAATPGLECELCGGPVLDRHCKVVCLNCGFQRDCSDP